MFNNIGSKIKALAKVICWIGIIASIIGGIGCIVADEDMILYGLLIAIFGSLFSWIGSFFTYGFGELIDNSSKLVAIAEKTEK